MIKAFFDLRKNYGFRWNMNLSHILTCLINFGADEAVVYNERFFQKHLEKHFDAVRKSGQKIIKKYEPTYLAKTRKNCLKYCLMIKIKFIQSLTMTITVLYIK